MKAASEDVLRILGEEQGRKAHKKNMEMALREPLRDLEKLVKDVQTADVEGDHKKAIEKAQDAVAKAKSATGASHGSSD